MSQIDLKQDVVVRRDRVKASSFLYVIPFVLIGLGILLTVTIFLIPVGIALFVLGVISAVVVAVFDRTPKTETESNRVGSPTPDLEE